MEITSVQNQKIKDVIKLRKAGERKKRGLIIVEGEKEIEMAIASGIKIETYFFCPEFNTNGKVHASISGKNIFILSKAVFKKISYRENPDGYLALAKPKKLELNKIKLSKNPLILILEAVEKPGNLGAIFRTADAAGVDAVLLCGQITDPFNPNVIRASRGTIFTVQFCSGDTEKIRAWLKKNNIKIYAAAPDAKKVYSGVNYKKPTAFVIGSEHDGLSREWLKNADEKIKIPMLGKIDSLNASVSAAVALYEAIRQRSL